MSSLSDIISQQWGGEEPKPKKKKPLFIQDPLPVKKNRGRSDIFHPDTDTPGATTLPEKKTAEEIRKLKIANENALRNLVEKSLVQSVMGEVRQSIQTNFVDLARRESPTLAARWGCPEKEKEIEFDLAKIIENSLKSFIDTTIRLSEDEAYERD